MSSQLEKTLQSAPPLDSSQILVEVQLKLIYYLETVLTFVRARTVAALSECATKVNDYFADSILYSTLFHVKTYFLNNTVRRKRLLSWLTDKLRSPLTPTNFTDDWRDGIRLCALCEAIAPGACPRYDLLSPANAQSNLRLALNLIQVYLHVKPSITVTEIYEASSEAKLVHFLSQIRISYAKRIIKSTGSSWLKLPSNSPTDASRALLLPSSEFFFSRCFVKGMGLIGGVRSRRSRFSLYYYEPLPKISLFFEIVGPNGSFCSEKVVAEFNGGPMEGESDSDDEQDKALNHKTQDLVQAMLIRAAMQRKTVAKEANMKIPFFSKIFDDHILLTYVPLFTGEHTISIIWQGQHILNSPYSVTIEESEYQETDSLGDIGIKFEQGFQYPLCLLKEHKDSPLDKMATVARTKVVKKSIVANGKEYDYKDYFESDFTPTFLKPHSTHESHPAPARGKSFSLDEATSTLELSNQRAAVPSTSAPLPATPSSSSSSRKYSIDSGISHEGKETRVKSSAQDSRTVVKTRITERKISFEESKVKITERSKGGKSRGRAHRKEEGTGVPEIKVNSSGEEGGAVTNPSSTASTASTPTSRTPSLKTMMRENSQTFEEKMAKLRKSLETNLHRYKAQLESSV